MDGHDVAGAVRRRELPWEARQRIGERLAMAPHDRHAAAAAAHVVGQTARNMRRLRAQARKGPPPRRGRPPIAQSERMRVRGLVEEEWLRQGATTGARTILRQLRQAEPKISRQLVEERLAELKADAERRAAEAREAARQGHVVLGRDTVWAEDTTHLGRLPTGEECAGEHIKDRGTWLTVSLTVGATPTAEDALRDLRRTAKERGGWPLVLQLDNGSIYLAKSMQAALAEEWVIVLHSRVHTPTDNPAIEHGHGEVKAECGLGKGVVLACHAQALERLEPAVERLNHARLRPSRGWHTAAELDRMLPRGDACVDRKQFYERTRAAMEAATRGIEDPTVARLAEREAVITALCEAGLARRHVGRRPRVGPIPMPAQPLPSGNRGKKG